MCFPCCHHDCMCSLCPGDCLWGYPFAGPRTGILFQSKRSRRYRVLLGLLEDAAAQLEAPKSRWASVCQICSLCLCSLCLFSLPVRPVLSGLSRRLLSKGELGRRHVVKDCSCYATRHYSATQLLWCTLVFSTKPHLLCHHASVLRPVALS